MEQLQALDKLYDRISMTLIKSGSDQHAWKYVCRLSHNGQMESFDYSWGKGLKGDPRKEDLIASLLSDWDCINQCGISEYDNGLSYDNKIEDFANEFGYDSYGKASETVNEIRENIEKLCRLFTEEELDILKGESND